MLERLGLVSVSPSAAPSRSPPRRGEYPPPLLALGVPRPDGSGLLAVVVPPLLCRLRPWPTCSSTRAGVGGELRSLSPAGGHGLAEALDVGRPGA